MLRTSATSDRVRNRLDAMVPTFWHLPASGPRCPQFRSQWAGDSGKIPDMAFPSPTPQRVRKPRWLDLRLVFGIVLVLAAVLIGAKVVATARHTDKELAVTRNLAAGTTIR